jgi:hypothetical protein
MILKYIKAVKITLYISLNECVVTLKNSFVVMFVMCRHPGLLLAMDGCISRLFNSSFTFCMEIFVDIHVMGYQ